MNSYYSNLIEGQSTHPHNIERALKKDFSDRPDTARLQRIALAHLEAERELEGVDEEPLSAAFVARAHSAMYSRLAEPDRTNPDGIVVEPGALRAQYVTVGLHLAPVPESLPRFLSAYDLAYRRGDSLQSRLIAIAAAHHRLAWIHPFVDGNGRATRLVSHCALLPFSEGLWSICRGLARRRTDYYARLRDADGVRRGDLDGRGNLSNQGLISWCQFFLEVCLDQVDFMGKLLDLDAMKQRILGLINFRAAIGKDHKPEAALALHHVFSAGPVTRGEFKQLTGLSDRTAQRQLQALLADGLLESSSPLGPVRIGLPLDALQFLFPDLYPEAAMLPD
jgi:Fic family protein